MRKGGRFGVLFFLSSLCEVSGFFFKASAIKQQHSSIGYNFLIYKISIVIYNFLLFHPKPVCIGGGGKGWLGGMFDSFKRRLGWIDCPQFVLLSSLPNLLVC